MDFVSQLSKVFSAAKAIFSEIAADFYSNPNGEVEKQRAADSGQGKLEEGSYYD